MNFYLNTLKRQAWIIVLCLMAGLAGGSIGLLFQTAQYSSTAITYISSQSGDESATTAYQGSLLSSERVKSYAPLVTSERILEEVRLDTRSSLTVEELSKRISVSNDSGTVLLLIRASDADPVMAANLANSTAKAFTALVAELERPADGFRPPAVVARVAQPAVANYEATSPNAPLNISAGLFFGLVVGVAAALYRQSRDRSVDSSDELATLLGTPVLGRIPVESVLASSEAIRGDVSPAAAEEFRRIRTGLTFADIDQPDRIIAITSSLESEGKTTTACHIASAYAEAGMRVLLVDADLRRPRVQQALGIDAPLGLTNVLGGRASLEQSIQYAGAPRFGVLASGPLPPNPSELVGSEQMQAVLHRAIKMFDLVLVDCPPALPVTDASLIASKCSGTLIVARYRGVTDSQIKEVRNLLENVGAKLYGAVMNMVPDGMRAGYSSYYTRKPSQSARDQVVPRETDESTEVHSRRELQDATPSPRPRQRPRT